MVSNPAAGMTDAVIDHNDVLAAAQVAAANLQRLLMELLRSPELV